MAFQGLHGDVFDLVGAFAEELLGGGGNGDVVAFDLDLRDAIHAHGHTLAGIDILLLCTSMVSSSSERMSTFSRTGQTRTPPPLTMRKPTCARAVGIDNAMLASGDDEDLVRADLGVAVGEDSADDEQEDDNDGADGDGADPGDFDFSERGIRFIYWLIGRLRLGGERVAVRHKTGCPRCA